MAVKRKLDAAFAESIEKVHKLTTELMSVKQGKVGVFQNFMMVIGKGCGYCLLRGMSEPKEHFGHECPLMPKVMKERFQCFQSSIRYPAGFKTQLPCFRCHVCSLGEDNLHPKFTTGGHGDCPNPNLVLQLGFGIFYDAGLQKSAEMDLQPGKWEHSWQTLDKFKEWMMGENEEYCTNGMALLACTSSRRSGVEVELDVFMG